MTSGGVGPIIVAGSVTAGRGDAGAIVNTTSGPQVVSPRKSMQSIPKRIVSAPDVAFASSIAARSVQIPPPSQTPSPGALSDVSAVESTTRRSPAFAGIGAVERKATPIARVASATSRFTGIRPLQQTYCNGTLAAVKRQP